MANYANWAEVVKAANLGDEEAAELLGSRIEQMEAGQAAAQDRSAVQEELANLRGKSQFLTKVHTCELRHPELLQDEELRDKWFEKDAELFQRYRGTLDEDRRLELAFELADEDAGDPESRDYGLAFETIGKGRNHVTPRKAPRDTSDEAELDRERSSTIADMAAERERLKQSGALAYRHKKDAEEIR